MPKINLNIGKRNLVLSYEEGSNGFVELFEDINNSSKVLHVGLEEDEHLWATFFPPNQEEPDWFFDLDDYEEYIN